jgi:hypothetical protein
MEDISSYLKKFKRIISSNEEEIKIVSEEVYKIINFSISPKEISIKRNVVFFQTKPTIKNQIFIHKEEILESLREAGLNGVTDLR